MNRKEKLRSAIAKNKKSLNKVKTNLDGLIEKIYRPLDEEDFNSNKPIHNIKNKKFILEDEFLNNQIPLRSIDSRKKLIEIYQSVISSLVKHIILFEEEIAKEE